MTVVVTGASGHLGANLVRALLAQGQAVRALIHHDCRAMEGLDVELVQGDVCDPASLERAFADAEVVYHAAAHISVLATEWAELHNTNIVGTRNVVHACLRGGVRRLVYFSSIHALQQEPLDTPVDESRPLVDSPNAMPYDRSKAAAEREVQQGMAQGLDAIILNPTALIGPYDFYPSHVGEVLLAIARRRMPALVASGFDWVDARDVAEGALRAAERAPAGARYLLSGQWVAMPQLAALIHEITGVPTPRLMCPMPLARMVAPLFTAYAHMTGRRPLFTSVSLHELAQGNPQISHAQATRELGYQPRPLRDTLADTYRWFAENGQLG